MPTTGVFAACMRCSKASRETGAAGTVCAACLPPHLVCAEAISSESASDDGGSAPRDPSLPDPAAATAAAAAADDDDAAAGVVSVEAEGGSSSVRAAEGVCPGVRTG